MKVLVLSPYPEGILPAFDVTGDTAVVHSDGIDPAFLEAKGIEHVVSYGYRRILREETLDCLPGRMVNLHYSLLPWNRGADSNFWSFFDDTPKGVTVHVIDAGVDTGPVLAQAEVHFSDTETLATSYWLLRERVEQLFIENWSGIRNGTVTPVPQSGPGSYHRSADKEPFFELLPDGWETPVSIVEEIGARHRAGG